MDIPPAAFDGIIVIDDGDLCAERAGYRFIRLPLLPLSY